MSLCYLVQWLDVENSLKKNVTVKSSPHAITGLQKSTNYTICVATVYEGVASECSKEVYVQTMQGNKFA